MGKGAQQAKRVEKVEKDSALAKQITEGLNGARKPFVIPTEFPKRSEILAAIPSHCFEKSLLKSLAYAGFSTVLVLVTGYLAWAFLPTPSWSPLSVVLWALYACVNGTIATGCWVAAHECGHGAFCDNKYIQDAVGYVLHSALLVPYFAWQRSHAVHHSRTNHLTEGETHVPHCADGADGKSALWLSHTLGEDAFTVLNLFQHLILGWPAYLLAGISGSPKRGFSNHFVPTNKALFPGAWQMKVWLSDIGVVAVIAGLVYWSSFIGSHYTMALYMGPYLGVNFWLVLYTWLQHSDVDIPHYDSDEWTWEKGAFCTVDRPYPEPFDFLHHRIGSTHVAHHLCSNIPHYNAREATEAIKKAFPAHYLYDPTPITETTWRVGSKCIAVAREEGNRYFYTAKAHKVE